MITSSNHQKLLNSNADYKWGKEDNYVIKILVGRVSLTEAPVSTILRIIDHNPVRTDF